MMVCNPRRRLTSSIPERVRPLAACCVTLLASATLADETERPLRDPVEAEITVTATLPELVTESAVPGSELEALGEADLVEGFRSLPGLSAIRRGAINLEPTVRGLQEDQIALTVDGTRTFAAGPGRMDSNLSHVGLHAVESVRVVKGPYALAWGSGALSAVDLITRRPVAGSGHAVSFGGSWIDNGDRADAFAGFEHAGERTQLRLDLGHRSGSDVEAGDGSTIPGDYRSSEARWRLGTLVRPRLRLDLSGGYQQQDDLDYAGRLLDATYFYARSHALDLEWSGDGGSSIDRIHAQVYSNRKDHRMNNDEKPTARDMPGRIPPFALRVDLPTESNTLGGRFRVDGIGRELSHGSTSWSAGVDAYRVEQTATRTISRRADDRVLFTDTVWPDATIEDLGSWVQWTHGGDRLRVGATVRVDAVSARADAPSAFFLADTSGDLDADETAWSAALSAVWTLGDWIVEAGVGRVSRSATTLERYSDRFPGTKFQIAAELMGNPNLDPETGIELDLGARWRRGSWSVSIEGFARRIDDVITVAPDPSLPTRLPLSPPVVFRYLNGDHAAFVGTELSVEHRASDRILWRVDADWLRADDETFDEPLLGIPPLIAQLAVRGELVAGRLWADLGLRWRDDQDRVAVARFEQPTDGATTLDLGFDWRLAGWWLEVDIENLTDEAYADHLNAPNPFTGQRVLEPGRSVRVAVRLDR
ncbi:MAG: TonB-dependent receptor [Acidobacteriota bacterium]